MLHYVLIAAGFLCTAINLEINGLGILLPTCVGYALIASGAWGLRELQRVYWGVVGAAGVMAIVTIPSLYAGFTTQPSGVLGQFIWWLGLILDLLIYSVVAIAVFREARIYAAQGIQIAAVLVVPVVLVCFTAWWVMPTPTNGALILSFFIYVVPMFYLSGLSFAAAKSL